MSLIFPVSCSANPSPTLHECFLFHFPLISFIFFFFLHFLLLSSLSCVFFFLFFSPVRLFSSKRVLFFWTQPHTLSMYILHLFLSTCQNQLWKFFFHKKWCSLIGLISPLSKTSPSYSYTCSVDSTNLEITLKQWTVHLGIVTLWTRIFHMFPHSIGETRFLFVKNYLVLEKLEPPLILFLF